MLFNSFAFVAFFALVYASYLLLRRHHRAQNVLLLIASYVFYGYWDWRFISLLIVSTLTNFVAAKRIGASTSSGERRFLLILAVFVNLSILGFFKYFNFFADSFVDVLNAAGFSISDMTLQLLLPVGISFYTFQAMGYTIDVYREQIRPTRNILDFALFVSFFPQLVAGPIERAASLLPQLSSPRNITSQQVNGGVFLVLWGFFKKVVIADNLGAIANQVFDGYAQFAGLDIIIATLAFTVQIYCDFSGYSDIARGLCHLLGIDLMVNFKLPFFALNPRDFWTRWHISLSTWLRDYLYIPLGGNRKGHLKTYRNLGLTMLLGGLWHGAAWNFVMWGAYQGLILAIYRLLKRDREDVNSRVIHLSWPLIAGKMLLMFTLTAVGWTVFRSASVSQVVYMATHLGPQMSQDSLGFGLDLVFFTLPLVVVQVYQYVTGNLLIVTTIRPWRRILVYSLLLVGIVVFGFRESLEFIYFQF